MLKTGICVLAIIAGLLLQETAEARGRIGGGRIGASRGGGGRSLPSRGFLGEVFLVGFLEMWGRPRVRFLIVVSIAALYFLFRNGQRQLAALGIRLARLVRAIGQSEPTEIS